MKTQEQVNEEIDAWEKSLNSTDDLAILTAFQKSLTEVSKEICRPISAEAYVYHCILANRMLNVLVKHNFVLPDGFADTLWCGIPGFITKWPTPEDKLWIEFYKKFRDQVWKGTR
jgi:hypothetical protein